MSGGVGGAHRGEGQLAAGVGAAYGYAAHRFARRTSSADGSRRDGGEDWDWEVRWERRENLRMRPGIKKIQCSEPLRGPESRIKKITR